MPKRLGIHETLELHELLTFKNTCLTKSAAMSNLASDAALKDILVQDVSQSEQDIQTLQNLISQQQGETIHE
ncbi:spore coat protein [Shimazuella alba]|uniref:Spore coat protein n=1 Tax=Shimazuella alba TaxID=2690964 RepID=A0A6I4VS55_9BACL|nr:spore coat protein [Shimazuella alba]MXQ54417.1 spore coat protein [Shimazuella alba]